MGNSLLVANNANLLYACMIQLKIPQNDAVNDKNSIVYLILKRRFPCRYRCVCLNSLDSDSTNTSIQIGIVYEGVSSQPAVVYTQWNYRNTLH